MGTSDADPPRSEKGMRNLRDGARVSHRAEIWIRPHEQGEVRQAGRLSELDAEVGQVAERRRHTDPQLHHACSTRSAAIET